MALYDGIHNVVQAGITPFGGALTFLPQFAGKNTV